MLYLDLGINPSKCLIFKLNSKSTILKMLTKVSRFPEPLLINHLDGVTSVAVTSDNRYVISGSWDKSIKVFDLQTKQQVHHFENAHDRIEIYNPGINRSFRLHFFSSYHIR